MGSLCPAGDLLRGNKRLPLFLVRPVNRLTIQHKPTDHPGVRLFGVNACEGIRDLATAGLYAVQAS
jgi:hypothetical protein